MADRIWPNPLGAEVPAWLLKRREVSAVPKLVYGRLAAVGRLHGVATVTLAALAADVGLTPNEAREYLAQLVADGLVEVEGSTDANGALLVWFLRHAWQEEPGKGKRKATNTHTIDLAAPSRASRAVSSLSLFSSEEQKDKHLPATGDDAVQGQPPAYVREGSAPASQTSQVVFLGSSGDALPSRAIDPYAAFPRADLPRLVQRPLDVLEGLWRAMQEKLQPEVSAAPWGGQERRIILSLHARYDWPDIETLITYLGERWSDLRGQFRQAPLQPSLVWVQRLHETLMAQARQYSGHAATLRAWEAWQEANRNDINAEPPADLLQAWKQARQDLAQRRS